MPKTARQIFESRICAQPEFENTSLGTRAILNEVLSQYFPNLKYKIDYVFAATPWWNYTFAVNYDRLTIGLHFLLNHQDTPKQVMRCMLIESLCDLSVSREALHELEYGTLWVASKRKTVELTGDYYNCYMWLYDQFPMMLMCRGMWLKKFTKVANSLRDMPRISFAQSDQHTNRQLSTTFIDAVVEKYWKSVRRRMKRRNPGVFCPIEPPTVH